MKEASEYSSEYSRGKAPIIHRSLTQQKRLHTAGYDCLALSFLEALKHQVQLLFLTFTYVDKTLVCDHSHESL